MFERIPKSLYFPLASTAPDDGLLCGGGEVVPDMIVDALIHGIFPWTLELDVANPDAGQDESEKMFSLLSSRCQNAIWNEHNFFSLKSFKESGQTLFWYSPDPRAVLDLETLHIPSRLRRTMQSQKFKVTFDEAFPEVMLGCALAGNRAPEGSWISKEFFCGYCKLHEMGFAHSVECWLQENETKKEKLVGGVYGVAINGFFGGESMFHTETDASKVALFTLCNRLKEKSFQLFDLQVLNAHTKSLGGKEIPRAEYLRLLEKAVLTPTIF